MKNHRCRRTLSCTEKPRAKEWPLSCGPKPGLLLTDWTLLQTPSVPSPIPSSHAVCLPDTIPSIPSRVTLFPRLLSTPLKLRPPLFPAFPMETKQNYILGSSSYRPFTSKLPQTTRASHSSSPTSSRFSAHSRLASASPSCSAF